MTALNVFAERCAVGVRDADAATTFDTLNLYASSSLFSAILEARSFQETVTAAEKAMGSPSKLHELLRQQFSSLSPNEMPYVSPVQSPKALFSYSPETLKLLDSILSLSPTEVQHAASIATPSIATPSLTSGVVETKAAGTMLKGKLKRCDCCMSAFKNAPLDAFSLNVQVLWLLWFCDCCVVFVVFVIVLWFCGYVVMYIVVECRRMFVMFADRSTMPRKLEPPLGAVCRR